MQLYIVTGTTKGLGLSLLSDALSRGHTVISISRTNNVKHPLHFNIKHDLAKIKGLDKKIEKILENKIDLKKIKSIHLINNAAVINPIGNIADFSFDDINSHMQVNFIAPVFLTGFILKKFKRKKCMQTFTNINSGAGMRAIPGWSLYCSSKAGLIMFTACMENDFKGENVRFLDFFPGVMDTGMQATIRKQNEKTFNLVKDFKELKEKNLLLSTDTVAKAVLDILAKPEAINKTRFDIKDFI